MSLLPSHTWAQQPSGAPAPIRFVLSFDDGPSAAVNANPTAHILDVLESNGIQPGIKGIFFAQTRSHNGGSQEVGQKLLVREANERHLLAFHTATPRHANHRYLPPEELELSLEVGVSDLALITGKAPTLVRPPFWNYDSRTLMAYHKHGMQMLLTDLNANDGKIYGVNFSLHKRRNMLKQLSQLRQHWLDGELPVVDGSTPVVVTFHDVNSYTASVIETYLQILLDVARELEIPTAPKAFYDDRDQLERAALSRTVQDANVKVQLPGFWNWLWQ
jgi:peptidoglycan/xylan/chitin deacetylase (PgdA/CDA1 family)